MNHITLKFARTLLGWNQPECDRRCGFRRGTTQDLENRGGENPSHDRVTRIVRAMRSAGLRGLQAEHLFPVQFEPVDDAAVADQRAASA